MRDKNLSVAAACLFLSGFCALVYQCIWMREFRLIFGASTPATAAVLALFMAGLGTGSRVLGKKVDRSSDPFRLYARWEGFIALSAAATPFLLKGVLGIYLLLGGASSLRGWAEPTRFLLAAVVLGVPTFFMGGTFPAAARFATGDRDPTRRNPAVLYGVNTLGAVLGVLVVTFYSIEHFGNRATLFGATSLNLAVALFAFYFSRNRAEEPMTSSAVTKSNASRKFLCLAAFVSGFVFFLLELVWYRMFSPLLGGSVFTFGLILAIALLGVGVGGLFYRRLFSKVSPTLESFAWVSLLGASCLITTYAGGDGFAYLAQLLRPERMSFSLLVSGWAVVIFLVVFPTTFFAGIQFPIVVGLFGFGGRRIGHEIGLAYFWNTIGSICGAISGGFVLFPTFSAGRVWLGSALLLIFISWVAVFLESRNGLHRRFFRKALVFSMVMICPLIFIQGPTGAWRHGGIGVGRAGLSENSFDQFTRWADGVNRSVLWEMEGRESSVAVLAGGSLVVNGKSDGSAVDDAGTQVMGGLIGAILHPNPQNALVIGLGTGSTAGWLALVPSVERVDVVELEPAILRAAELFSAPNRNVLSNEKVKIFVEDGREFLSTTREQYDIIFSEPSNPYRAGIASLFTKEFYENVGHRLRHGGIFLQWIQAYDVDEREISVVYKTIRSTFPSVELFRTMSRDLLFVVSREPRIRHSMSSVRQKALMEPFRRAMHLAWRARGVEGIISRYVGGGCLESTFREGAINTDDHMILEYSFARRVGHQLSIDIDALHQKAVGMGCGVPAGWEEEGIDWENVEDQLASLYAVENVLPPVSPNATAAQKKRNEAKGAFLRGELKRVLELWRGQPRKANDLLELEMLAEAEAVVGNAKSAILGGDLQEFQPTEALILKAAVDWRRGDLKESKESLLLAIEKYRHDPWPLPFLMSRGLGLAVQIAQRDRDARMRLIDALSRPFAFSILEGKRQELLGKIAEADTR